jgi:RNA polymerase sigma-70 factor (ECF subfamily)
VAPAPLLAGEADDSDAIRAVLAGDEEAFRVLVDRYRHSIFNLAYRLTGRPHDAEDLAQDTFLQAYAHLGEFRAGARFHPWLYTIALNLCRNQLRRKRLLRWLPFQSAREEHPRIVEPPERRHPDPEQAVLEKEREDQLQAAIQALPLKYREVFLLRQLEELSYEEIAQVTGLPMGTVEVRLFRARKKLVEHLGANNGGNRTRGRTYMGSGRG